MRRKLHKYRINSGFIRYFYSGSDRFEFAFISGLTIFELSVIIILDIKLYVTDNAATRLMYILLCIVVIHSPQFALMLLPSIMALFLISSVQVVQ